MRLPTGKEQMVLGVMLSVLVGLVAFKFGAGTKNTREKASKAQTTGTQAQRQANQAKSLGEDAQSLVRAQLDCLRGKNSEQCIRDLFRLNPRAQGAAGRQGARGGVGPAGPTGSPGVRGPQGRPGPRGPRGIPGASPDPLAPIPGPQGDPGKSCDPDTNPDCRGPKGDAGSQGERGATGAAGEGFDCAGNPVPSGSAPATCPGATGAQGPPGADSTVPGPQGAQGPPGAPGSPPASFTFTFLDANGVQVTMTCVDPDGNLAYTCTPG